MLSEDATAMWHFRIAFGDPSDRTDFAVGGSQRPASRARALVQSFVAALIGVPALGAIAMGFVFVPLLFLVFLAAATAVLVFRRLFSRRHARVLPNIVVSPSQGSSRNDQLRR